jgi:hypothetical protein
LGNDDCERTSIPYRNREDRFTFFNPPVLAIDRSGALVLGSQWVVVPGVPQSTTDRSRSRAPQVFRVPAAIVGPWTSLAAYLQDFGIIQKRFQNGWFRIGFHDPDAAINSVPVPLNRPPLVETSVAAPLAPDRYFGLPAIGFWALRVENQNARPGVMAFYGGAYPHRSTRACYKGQFAAPQLWTELSRFPPMDARRVIARFRAANQARIRARLG